jgi:hypothetical protein
MVAEECRAAGVAICAAGFEPDDAGGCEPLLPSTPCASGQMAIVGETACRDVKTCDGGRWGAAPLSASTQFVDAAATNGDGSENSPWTTIQQAVDAAASGAVIALAAGSYQEDVVIENKSLSLWGRCPAMVEIVATGVELGAVFIGTNATGSEIHDIAVRGAAHGIVVSGSEDVLLDRVWIHSTPDRGLDIEDVLGPTAVTLEGSLLEETSDVGLYASGATVDVAATVIRNTQPDPSTQQSGRGIAVQDDAATGARGALTLRSSVVEQSRDAAVYVFGSDALVEASVVRATAPAASDDRFGRGISANNGLVGNGRANVTLRGSVVENSRHTALFAAGSDILIENSVLRDTEAQLSDETGGRGINVQLDPMRGERGVLVIRTSVVERSRDIGIFVDASDATIEGVIVRTTVARPDGAFGDGLSVSAAQNPASAIVTGAHIETSARAGIVSFGAFVSLGGTALECNVIALDGEDVAAGQFAFEDRGNNGCGCPGATEACKAVSTMLDAPGAISP